MLLTKALALYLISMRSVHAAESKEAAPKKTDNAIFPQIEYLTREDCSKITRDEMEVIVSYYPYVKVQCLAERSTLIPTELQVPENLASVKVPGLFSGIWGQRKYTFNEFLRVSESSNKRVGVPISPCSGVKGSGKGNFELTVAIRGVLSVMMSASRGLHYLESKIGLKGTFGEEVEMSHSVLCQFGEHRVRPVAEVTTITTHERIRQWVVELRKTPFIDLEPWADLEREQVLEDTLVVACISEKHIPGVCELDDTQLYNFMSTRSLLPSGKSEG